MYPGVILNLNGFVFFFQFLLALSNLWRTFSEFTYQHQINNTDLFSVYVHCAEIRSWWWKETVSKKLSVSSSLNFDEKYFSVIFLTTSVWPHVRCSCSPCLTLPLYRLFLFHSHKRLCRCKFCGPHLWLFSLSYSTSGSRSDPLQEHKK